jgi:hypothetical protein
MIADDEARRSAGAPDCSLLIREGEPIDCVKPDGAPGPVLTIGPVRLMLTFGQLAAVMDAADRCLGTDDWPAARAAPAVDDWPGFEPNRD